MATMADVARAAGVSTATVSHVLNDTRVVSNETAERVREAIDRVGYRVDFLARALRTSRTFSVGVVVSDTGHPIFADMIHGIDDVAVKAGLTMLLAHSDERPGREREAIDALRERRIDGLLIVPAAGSDHEALSEAVGSGLPVVVIDRPIDLDVDRVASDAEPSLRALTRHILAHGHQQVGIVVGTTENETNSERLAACVDELAAAGCDVAPEHIVTVSLADVRRSLTATRIAVAEMLARPGAPTALISLNAEMTVAALQGTSDAGLRIPDDVALVALDDLPWSQIIEPKITCAEQPAAELGRAAMTQLLRRIDDPTIPSESQKLACVMHHRQSCGCTDGEVELENPRHDTDETTRKGEL